MDLLLKLISNIILFGGDFSKLSKTDEIILIIISLPFIIIDFIKKHIAIVIVIIIILTIIFMLIYERNRVLKSKMCSICGTVNKKDMQICSICGTSLKKNDNLKEKVQTLETISKIENSKTISIPKKEKSPNPTLAVYKEQEKPVITEKAKKKCPKCGAGNGLEAKYCFICNTEFKDNQR